MNLNIFCFDLILNRIMKRCKFTKILKLYKISEIYIKAHYIKKKGWEVLIIKMCNSN